MMANRRPCVFRQRDVTKAVRAVAAAGVQIDRVEVDKTGKIVIVTRNVLGDSSNNSPANEWDEKYGAADPAIR
jgi:hypothetical protein